MTEEVGRSVFKFFKGGEVATTRNYFVIKVPQPFDQIKVGGI